MKYIWVLVIFLVLFGYAPLFAQTTLTFEGISDNTPIGFYSGVTFGSSWYSLVDFDAGGSGNLANEPSPSTVAYPGLVTPDIFRITFPQPITSGSFYYVFNNSTGPVTVHFYDTLGIEITTTILNVCGVTGASGCGAVCSGDPTGDYCLWTLAVIAPGTAYMEFEGLTTANFAIDNLIFESQVALPTITQWGSIVFVMLAGLGAIYYLSKQRRVEN